MLTTIGLCLVLLGTGDDGDRDCPPCCEIRFVSKRPSKPPAVIYQLDVTIKNPDDHPRWFILPYSVDDCLGTEAIRFARHGDPPFEASKYRGLDGSAVMVRCLNGSRSINALLLPPHG